MAVTVALDRLGMENWMGRWDGYKEDGMEERRKVFFITHERH
jgi:hypothetical protein